MKKLLLLILALSLPLAQAVRADNDKDRKKHRPAQDQRRAQGAPAAVNGPRQAASRPAQRQVQRRSPFTSDVRRQPARSEVNRDARGRSDRTVNRPVVRENRAPERVAKQRDRGHREIHRNSFSVARSRVIRVPHDRHWWHRHFNTTFVLFGGGYYYWWDGWWYPAYGYSPYYNNYIYSEPIYGYNNLEPGQVIANVQIALRDQGYYPGAIDGLMGPQTRSALAAYQRDHGLIVTAAVDQPTLVTLGLT
jgi:hypothetical protein